MGEVREGQTPPQLALEQAKRTNGSVEQLAREGNVYFLHGIAAEKRLSWINNRSQARDISWENKLSTLLKNKPEIAASTIKYGKRAPHTWSPIGVLLSGGQVEYAHVGDAGSVVDNTGSRGTRYQPKDEKEYQFHLRIAKGGSGFSPQGWSHNEVGISSPEVAGIYINLDSPQVVNENQIRFNSPVVWPRLGEGVHRSMSLVDLFRLADEHELKVFLLEHGVAYEGETIRDQTGRHLIKKKEVTPQKMTSKQYQTPNSIPA